MGEYFPLGLLRRARPPDDERVRVVIEIAELLVMLPEDFHPALRLEFPEARQIAVQILAALVILEREVVAQAAFIVEFVDGFHVYADQRPGPQQELEEVLVPGADLLERAECIDRAVRIEGQVRVRGEEIKNSSRYLPAVMAGHLANDVLGRPGPIEAIQLFFRVFLSQPG